MKSRTPAPSKLPLPEDAGQQWRVQDSARAAGMALGRFRVDAMKLAASVVGPPEKVRAYLGASIAPALADCPADERGVIRGVFDAAVQWAIEARPRAM